MSNTTETLFLITGLILLNVMIYGLSSMFWIAANLK